MPDVPRRKLRLFEVGLDELLAFLRGCDGQRRWLIREFPDDARVVGAVLAGDARSVHLLVESDEYPAHLEGNFVPLEAIDIREATPDAPGASNDQEIARAVAQLREKAFGLYGMVQRLDARMRDPDDVSG